MTKAQYDCMMTMFTWSNLVCALMWAFIWITPGSYWLWLYSLPPSHKTFKKNEEKIGAGVMCLFMVHLVGRFIGGIAMFNSWAYCKEVRAGEFTQEYETHTGEHIAASAATGSIVRFVPALLLSAVAALVLFRVKMSFNSVSAANAELSDAECLVVESGTADEERSGHGMTE